jgi:hypothetical protein
MHAEIFPVVLPPVTLPAVIFPDIVALSPVVCATTEFMTVNPVTDRAATPRMADIANIVIVIVFIGRYESSLIYKVATHW